MICRIFELKISHICRTMATRSTSNDELQRETIQKGDDGEPLPVPRSKSFSAHGFPIVPKRLTNSRVDETLHYNEKTDVSWFFLFALIYASGLKKELDFMLCEWRFETTHNGPLLSMCVKQYNSFYNHSVQILVNVFEQQSTSLLLRQLLNQDMETRTSFYGSSIWYM